MGSPYRNVSRGRGQTRDSVLYIPGLGIWPVVLALLVAVPGAYLARRNFAPATVTCNTMDVRPADAKMCSSSDGAALGRVRMVACRDTPQALEALLEPKNPFQVPHITATQIEFPAMPAMPFDSMAGCERKDKSKADCKPQSAASNGAVIIGSGVIINGRPVNGGEAPTVVAPKEWDPSDRITPDAARSLIGQCALTPDTSGASRSVTVIVMRNDYSRSALVVLGALAAALLVMMRRRVRVSLDMKLGLVEIVERGLFVTKRRSTLPANEVERAIVTAGPCGPLNGKRVELLLQGGGSLPLVDVFVLSISGVHTRTAFALTELLGRARFETRTLSPGPARSNLAVAFAVLVGAVSLGAPVAAYVLLQRTPTARPVPADVKLSRLGSSRDGSTVITGALGGRRLAIVSDDDQNSVRALDLPAASAPLGDTPDVLSATLASAPGAMVMDGNGRIFVTLPTEGAVAVLEAGKGAPATLRETGRISTESEPVALSLTKDDTTLVVVSNWGHTLEVFKTSTLDREFSVSLPRAPRTLTLSANDSVAAVAHEVGGVMSLVDLHTRQLTPRGLHVHATLPTQTQRTRTSVDTRGRSRTELFMERDTEWSPMLQNQITRVGDTFYAAGVVATTGNPNDTRVQYYGSGNVEEHFEVAVLRTGEDRGQTLGRSILTSQTSPAAGLGGRDCLLPRAAVVDEANEWLYVACEGPGRVYKIDLGGKERCHVDSAWGLPFAVADAPTGLALVDDDRSLLAWSPATQTLTVLPFDGGIQTASHWAASTSGLIRNPWRQWIHELPHPARDDQAELLAHGRELFHTTNDHRISASGVACANCHIGGRDDALTWPTPRGPRQTPMLAGRIAETAPYGWTGEHATLPVYLGQTFSRLGGAGLHGNDLEAITAYVQSIPGPRFQGKNSDAIARGRALFTSTEARCGGCHAGGTFTDHERHDIASNTPNDQQNDFDTPSLFFVSGSGPYFHDGRYATLLDVLEKNDDKMGHTSQLTTEQRRDLVSYLSSLGETRDDAPPRPRTTARVGGGGTR